jgi:uncharacterized protein YsxB (DUF464 family)
LVRVRVETAGECLRRLSVRGHDTSPRRGESLPCGIVSALARTTAGLLEKDKDIQWSGDAPEPGILWIDIENVPEHRKERMAGITGFLLKGFGDVEHDFPEIVQLEVKRT